MATKKMKRVLDTVSDLVLDFVYYDRKEDSELDCDAIDEILRDPDNRLAIVDHFSSLLEETAKDL